MSYDTYKVNNKPLIETAEMDFISDDALTPIESFDYCSGSQALKSYSHYLAKWEATRAIGDDYHKYYTYGTSKPKPIGREIDVSTMVNFGKIITIAGKAGTYNFFINRNTKSWECTCTDTSGTTSTFFNNRNLNYFGNAAGKVGKLPTRFIVALWGAGGGGGGSPEGTVYYSFPGAGGGSGAFWCGVINTDANWLHEFTVTIGAGGSGGFSTNNTNADGIDGGDSSISITDDNGQTSTLIVGGGKGGQGGGYAGTSIGGAGGTITLPDPSNYFYTLPLYEYSAASGEYDRMRISGTAVYASISGSSGGDAFKPGDQPNLPSQSENNIRVYSSGDLTLATDFFKTDTTYTNKAGKWYTSLFSTPGGTGLDGFGGGGASAVSIQLSLGDLLTGEDGSIAAKWTNGFKSCGGNGASYYNYAGADANNGNADKLVPGGMGAGGGGAGGCTGRAKIAGGNGYNGAMILFALDDLTTVGADIK